MVGAPTSIQLSYARVPLLYLNSWRKRQHPHRTLPCSQTLPGAAYSARGRVHCRRPTAIFRFALEKERRNYHRSSRGRWFWCMSHLVRDIRAGESTSYNWLSGQLNPRRRWETITVGSGILRLTCNRL